MLQRQTENCNNSFGQYQLRKLMNNLLKSLDRIDGYVEADLFHTVDGRGGGFAATGTIMVEEAWTKLQHTSIFLTALKVILK